jgi:hypothetical protein
MEQGEQSEGELGAVTVFRREYRAREIGPRYLGGLHAAFTLCGSLAVIVAAVSRVRELRALELLTVPLTFLFATFVEHRGHRVAMHRPVRGLQLIYQRHTLEHHRFFTHQTMAFDEVRDFKIMLFPPVLLLFFIGGFAVPVGALLFLIATPNVAWLYVGSALGYYLSYELLHFLYHCPAGSAVWLVPGLRALRRHHLTHHDPRLMGRYNFNITFPIFDWVFGTTYREK